MRTVGLQQTQNSKTRIKSYIAEKTLNCTDTAQVRNTCRRINETKLDRLKFREQVRCWLRPPQVLLSYGRNAEIPDVDSVPDTRKVSIENLDDPFAAVQDPLDEGEFRERQVRRQDPSDLPAQPEKRKTETCVSRRIKKQKHPLVFVDAQAVNEAMASGQKAFRRSQRTEANRATDRLQFAWAQKKRSCDQGCQSSSKQPNDA
ncbi:hypothetical protein FIV00_26125 [Labrenzia sp. THAF82]|nr:hypothetical protein FIV00_26125 [Labrenzia sp. THAF82]